MNQRILFVDDEPSILDGIRRVLRRDYELETAIEPEAALVRIEAGERFAVVVSDMRMPKMNGAEFLAKVREADPDAVRVVLTGHSELATTIEAVNNGHIFRFLTKPCSPDLLARTLDACLEQYRLVMSERELLEGTLNGAVQVLAQILSVIDPDAFGRSERIRELASAAGRVLGLPNAWEIESAASLAQIGVFTVPREVLCKAGRGEPLDDIECEMMRQVPRIGRDLLARIPRLSQVSRIVLHQRTNFDGSNSPEEGVSGEGIPLESRWLRILAEVVPREERGEPLEEIVADLRSQPSKYDPALLLPEFLEKVLGHDAASSAAEEVLSLGVDEIDQGHRLLHDAHGKDGQLLLRAGTRLDRAMLERLRNWSKVIGVEEPLIVTGGATGGRGASPRNSLEPQGIGRA